MIMPLSTGREKGIKKKREPPVNVLIPHHNPKKGRKKEDMMKMNILVSVVLYY